MKVLVTGVAGFIGYHLVKRLLDFDIEVVGLDNINDYYDVNLKYTRLQEIGILREKIVDNKATVSMIKPSFSFIRGDLTDYILLNDLFAAQKFDFVINLAAQAGVRYSLENPHAYVQSNIVGFVNILECCRHHNIKHLIYASSSSVYGMNSKIPFNEDDKVDFPVSLYAATKKSNELFAHTYSHLYGIPTTGLRFFTVYGPWGRPDMAPMLFTKAIYSGMPIKVFNKGEMQRDFTYIDDIIDGIKLVIDNIPRITDKQPYYRIFNLGNSKPIELMRFIHILEAEIGIKAKLDMCPMQPGDVTVTYADTSLLNKITGYNPSTTLDFGIEKFILWYRDYFSKNNG